MQLEAIVSYYLTDYFNVGVGGRYWAMWTTSATDTCNGCRGPEFPRPQATHNSIPSATASLSRPRTVGQIAKALLKSKGVTPTRKQLSGIEAGVRSSLENHAGKTVQRVGEGVPKRWRLI